MKLILILVSINLLFISIGLSFLYSVVKYFNLIVDLPFVLQFMLGGSLLRGLFYVFDGLRALTYIFGGKDESNSDNQ